MHISVTYRLEKTAQSMHMLMCPHGSQIKRWTTCVYKDSCSTLGKGEYMTFPDQCVSTKESWIAETLDGLYKIAHAFVHI